MRISIKTTLVSLFCVISLIVAALCAVALNGAYQLYVTAQEVTALGKIDRYLFEGLAHFRFERGESATALSMTNDLNQRSVANVGTRRAKVTPAVESAIAALRTNTNPKLVAATRELESQFNTVKDIRRQVDTQLQVALDKRDKAVPQAMLAEGGKVLASLEKLSTLVEADIRALDPSLSQLIQARAMGWAARNYAGASALLFNAAVADNRPLTPDEAKALAVNDGKAEFAWNTVREIGTAANAPQALQQAVRKAEDAYFGGPFKLLREGIAAKVTSGQPSGRTMAEWREPVEIALNELAAVVGVALESLDTVAEQSEAAARQRAIVYGIVLVVSLGLAGFGLLVVVRRVTQPMSRLTAVMQDVAGGDLTVEVPGTDRQDEIGSMAKTLLVFKDNLARTAQMEQEAEEARRAGEAQRREAMRDLADQFEAAVGSIIGGVSTASGALHQTAQQMSAAAEKTSAQSTAVAAAAEQASTNVVMVASSAEELGASVEEISRQVSQSSQMSATAVAEASKTGEVMRELAQAASRIGDVVNLINTIASQTNLLALNATIEAARAGDAGKGFAVVASEVKELATQTGKATEEIASQISAIQSTTQDAVRVIEGVSQQIRQMSDVATGISAAVEEQGIATREIVRNVDQAATGTNSVTSHITDVARTAQETGAAAGQVLGASSALTDQAKRLEVEMQRFLDTVRAA
ncbi:methyl-accepting chemotaxis protein [Azorhizobium doebereinerae]|uniref:methyl-accepting chemotaxis protein n=1 Tax=Azorhizobium doebereinerae TaxID=281091 RepID=UPI0004147458|nr:HAMP domain-containing methyl-accepting chemotaxis protein [Azorhizobium doebereinerae]